MSAGQVPALTLAGVHKSYGPTKALVDATMTVPSGEIVGLVGHNGAGKTTLVKIIAGIHRADGGTIDVGGETINAGFGVTIARDRGIALALQEIALCPDLRIEENLALTRPELVRPGWRRRIRAGIIQRLDEMFPGHAIAARSRVNALSLAQRQMLQIALATLSSDSALRLLILDEPTSALSDQFADSLFTYLHKTRRETGLAVLLVSHKMADILGHTDRTVVMRDGRVVGEHAADGLTTDRILESMGAAEPVSDSVPRSRTIPAGAPNVLAMDDLNWRALSDVSLSVKRGQIVGVAGLEGQGQRDVLEAAWSARGGALNLRRGLQRGVRVDGRVSYVSGDRQSDGIFPLWRVRENLTISELHRVRRAGSLSLRAERGEANNWIEKIGIKATEETQITSLSGGNQQKVLLARSLAVEPELLILDDPFRGVDIPTKREAYRLLRDQADQGRAILWYTTENSELLECDVVYVLRAGKVSAVFSGEDLTVDNMIAASFEAVAQVGAAV